MAIALKGDFIGFSFNGVRSEDLGLVRVSSSNRYSEDLLPTSQDKTVQVPGGDGFYYFGSNYTQRQFPISFAFDEITEEMFRDIQKTFGTQDLGKLIFDERPYKYYMVKASKPQLKYICFMQKDSVGVESRVYKGEGSITFTAYYPYAKSVHKYLDEFSEKNKGEWSSSSRMLETQGKDYDVIKYNESNKVATIDLYNPGDLEADFILTKEFQSQEDSPNSTSGGDIELKTGTADNVSSIGILSLAKTIVQKGQDTGFRINTKNHLIEGFTKDGLSGNLYNEYITGGDFFKIPVLTDTKTKTYLQYKLAEERTSSLEYDYIYY